VDREQHVTQDAAELYSVFVMQQSAEHLGVAKTPESSLLYGRFLQYLDGVGLNEATFRDGEYPEYKVNADSQLPDFVHRLTRHFPASKFGFENVEKEFRDRGLKGDFLLHATEAPEPISVSLKNYIGNGGIARPQVGSGTYASFTQGFIFDRVGVGTYTDPRTGGTFRGSDAATRNKILKHLSQEDLVPLLADLDNCQARVREEFLGPDCEYYDEKRVAAAARSVAEMGMKATLDVFEALGMDHVKGIVLTRSGLDGKEEALYFDRERYVDSITNRRYHELRVALNDDATRLEAFQQGQGIRLEFRRADDLVLGIHVPYTINTNGAWYRPKIRYSGTQTYSDKGHAVDLFWGQRRPYKSREIATSTNMYVDLKATGIFDS